jgi:2-methylcitrate dehydratase
LRIDKTGPLPNEAARDHCLQYMVAIALLRGRLGSADYSDAAAADPRVDALRACMRVVESPDYTANYKNPAIASCANAIRLTTTDGEISPVAEVLFPGGDPSRRADAMPLLAAKFQLLAGETWTPTQCDAFLALLADQPRLCAMSVGDFITRLNAGVRLPPDAGRSPR